MIIFGAGPILNLLPNPVSTKPGEGQSNYNAKILVRLPLGTKIQNLAIKYKKKFY